MDDAMEEEQGGFVQLPDDTRRVILQYLPVRSLLACERVSKFHRSVIRADNELWRPRVEAHWPSGNLGAAVPTYRSCYSSANGWMHLAECPRAAIQIGADECARSSRARTRRAEVSSFDADEETLYAATSDEKLRFRSPALEVVWSIDPNESVDDVKILPGGGALAVVGDLRGTRCRIVRLELPRDFEPSASPIEASLSGRNGDTIWSRRPDTFDPFFHEVLPIGTESALLVNRRDAFVRRLDLRTGTLVGYWGMDPTGEGSPFTLFRSVCHDAEHSPHELTTAFVHANGSVLHHHDLRLREATACSLRTGHAHVRRVRQGNAGTPTILTSHSRSKKVELWDLRKFGQDRGVSASSFFCERQACSV